MNEPTLSELHQKIDAGVRFAIAEASEHTSKVRKIDRHFQRGSDRQLNG